MDLAQTIKVTLFLVVLAASIIVGVTRYREVNSTNSVNCGNSSICPLPRRY